MRKKSLKFIIFFLAILISSSIHSQDSLKKHLGIKNLHNMFNFKSISNSAPHFKRILNNKWKDTFVHFKGNDLYLFAGMNLSKQTINEQSYHSSFNYRLEDINKNAMSPGYFIGARVDGKYNDKHLYSFIFGLNKYATGANYQNRKSIDPFIGAFTNFKADQQILALNTAAHYKYNIVFGDTTKRKLYLVVGPSIDIRLSNQSIDNQVDKLYSPIFLKADFGLEFDNHSYYTFFLHYKQGINSITKTPVSTNLNSIELGMLIKANDLF